MRGRLLRKNKNQALSCERAIKKKKETMYMFEKLFIWFNLFSLILCTGCAPVGYYEKNLFEYQPKPVFSNNKRIDKVVGVNLLLDKRFEEKKDTGEDVRKPQRGFFGFPPGNKHTRKTVGETITIILLEDFKKSNLFKEIHYPPQAGDEIIISGSLHTLLNDSKLTFFGEAQRNIWGFLFPPVGVAIFFGAPALQESCTIDISLEVKDNKSGMLLANFKESAKTIKGVSVYRWGAGEAVTNSFREVAGKLKENLIKIKF